MQVEHKEGSKVYMRSENNIYDEREQSIVINEMNGCFRCIINGNKVQVFEIVPRMVQSNIVNKPSEFSLPMMDAIVNREAVAATDASMCGNALATHWILSTKSNDGIQ